MLKPAKLLWKIYDPKTLIEKEVTQGRKHNEEQ